MNKPDTYIIDFNSLSAINSIEELKNFLRGCNPLNIEIHGSHAFKPTIYVLKDAKVRIDKVFLNLTTLRLEKIDADVKEYGKIRSGNIVTERTEVTAMVSRRINEEKNTQDFIVEMNNGMKIDENYFMGVIEVHLFYNDKIPGHPLTAIGFYSSNIIEW